MSRIKGITIELGGDTTKLDKAIKDVNKTSRDLQKELRGVNYALKLDPKNVEMLAQKKEILAKQVENAKVKVDALKQAHEKAGEEFKKGEISEEEFRKISREVVIAEGELKKFEKSLADINNTLKQTGESWKKTGDKITGVGKGLTKNVTAPILGMGAASMVAWAEIDEAIDGIALSTGAAGEEMAEFEQIFKDVYGSVPGTAEAIGAAIGEVNTQFGLQGDALAEVSELAVKYAEITGQDVSAAVIGTKKAMEVFELGVEDTAMVMDVFAKASQDTGVGTDKLQEAVRRAGPQLKDLNLTFEEAVVMMSEMEKNGIDSSTAMGYMSRASVNLAKQGKTLDQGMAELKDKLANTTDETDRLALVSELFGTRAGPLMLDAIERGALDFENFANRVGTAGGAVETTFETILDPADRAKLAFDNLKLVGYELGATIQETLTPAIEWMVEKLQALVQWFQNLPSGIQTAIVVVAGLAAAIGPLLIAIGTMIKLGGVLMTGLSGLGAAFTLLTGPVGLVIAAIAAAIAIGVAIYKNWEDIKKWASDLWGRITEIFAGIRDAIVGAWETVKNWTSDKWASIRDTISNLVDSIRTKITNVFDGVKSKISGVWDSIKSTTKNAWESVRKFITDPINKARDAVQSAIDKVKSILSGTLSFPKIKLPRFSLTGKFSLVPPSVPKIGIDWYDKGGIFTGPSIIGVGEKRPEFVGALEDLRYLIGSELDKRSGDREVSININIDTVENNRDDDIEELARRLAWSVRKELNLEIV